MKMRRAKPKHEAWIPHDYQMRATRFLCDKPSAALFLDPGLGKTSIVLNAFKALKDAGQARKMLVVAPLRVCQLVWAQEGQKWTQFRDLTFSLIHGPGKAKANALRADTDIYLINPEGIKWLAQQFIGMRMPFDTFVIDELTKFKNNRSKRNKMLRPHMDKAARRWGLTGTPAPNGYMDLFGQFLMLDSGRALGKYITHFRDLYFVKGFDGFTYSLQSTGAERIEERIKPIVLRMAGKDYLDLPQVINDVRLLRMDKRTLVKYQQMKETMVLQETGGGDVTAANAAGVSSKLSQIANGAVYATPDPTKPRTGKREVIHIHDLKLDALQELIDELCGQPLLIAYEFQHDLDRMKEHFGKDMPFLGKGMSAQATMDMEAAWNAGELPYLAAHPASIGHGLNMQQGGAGHICWFGVTWDFELYDQFIKRVARQGNTRKSIVNHILAVDGSVDLMKLQALQLKDTTQGALLNGLSFFVGANEEDISAAYAASQEGETKMVKLRRKSDIDAETETTQEVQEETTAPARRGRVKVKGWGDEPEAKPEIARAEPETEQERPPRKRRAGSGRKVTEQDGQAQRVNKRLRGDDYEDDEEPDVKAMFSDRVKEALNGEEEEKAPPKRRRAPTKAQKAEAKAAMDELVNEAKTRNSRDTADQQPDDLDYAALATAVVDELFRRIRLN